MNRWIRFLLFAVGILLFGHLLSDIGLPQLEEDALASGWMLVPIIALFAGVYLCNAMALRLILADEPTRPGFISLFATNVAGTALNFITPMINIGGEPFKVASLAPYVGTSRAAGAVVLHRMIQTLALLLVWMTAILLGFIMLPHTPPVIAMLAASLAIVAALVGLLLTAHRRGGVARVAGLVGRLPFLGRVARAIEANREAIEGMDRQITEFYHDQPARFRAALAWEYAARGVFMAEFCLIGAAIKVSVSYPAAFVVGGLEGLISNVFFFVPFQLGTRESATVLIFQLLGFHGAIGLFAALVGRIRDLAWIGIGLVMIWVRGASRIPRGREAGGTAR